jgi:glutathione synthase/RimK-type ligase-like ATP-grasp enzyme
MKFGIFRYPDQTDNSFVNKYAEILEYNKIDYVWLDINKPDFWQLVREIDIFIFRWIQWDDHHQIAKSILPVIEFYLGKKCFPNFKTCWHYDDKIREFYLMKVLNFPFVDSWVFYNKSDALKWIENEMNLPIVFKLKGGASSEGVLLIQSRKDARRITKMMFSKGFTSSKLFFKGSLTNSIYKKLRLHLSRTVKSIAGLPYDFYWQKHKNYVLFQKFLPNNDFDTRITVIGNRAFCFRRFNRADDFRSSGSGLLDYDQSKIDKDFIKIAFEVSEKLEFQSMAYDFLYDENGNHSFCEISYTYVDKAIYNCPGYWDRNLQFHSGHYWPQYFHIIDLINNPELKQPI